MKVALPFFAWATFLTVLAGVLWAWSSDHVPPAIFSAAAGIAWLVGLYALLRPFPRRDRYVPELTLAGVMTAAAVVLLVIGALVGPWLVLIGAGALVLGVVGMVVELRAGRRA